MFNFRTLQDLDLKNVEIRRQYYSYFLSGDYNSAFKLLSDHPEIDSQILTSGSLNELVNAILILENNYKTNVTDVLSAHLNKFQINIDELIYIGNYNPTEQYEINNFVIFNNDLYYCFKAPPVGTSPTNTTYWIFLGLKGEKGTPSLNVNYQGEYLSTRNYLLKDMVVYNGNLYVAKRASVGKTPTNSPADWFLAINVIPQNIYISETPDPNWTDGVVWIKILEQPAPVQFNYGYRVSKADPNTHTRIRYLEDTRDFISAKMNYNTNRWEWGSWESFVKEYFRPCMLNFDGTVAYYLDPNDQTKKADGTPSDVSNINFGGNAMVEVKKLYLWEYEDADYSYHMVSNNKINANYVAYPFINANGEEKEFAYFPMFEGSLDSNNRIRSIAEQTVDVSKTGQQQIDYVNSNGSGYYTDYWSAHNFMAVMHTLIGKSTDSQTTFGKGVCNATVAIPTGALKTTGGFFGYSNYVSCIKTFWMENSWGNIRKRCMGAVSNNLGDMLVKMTAPYNSTGSGYTNLGHAVRDNGGYIKYVTTSNNGYVCENVFGTGDTFYCDGWYQTADCYGTVSGYWSNFDYCGCYFFYLNNFFTQTDTSIGCRLFFINPQTN
ncbi:MAG: hypothetical protein RR322_02835 [Oscillospiraceae bacterium]